MKWIVALDFSRIFSREDDIPDIAVLDYLPVKGVLDTREPILGRVFRLRDWASETPLEVTAGPAIINVRLPGGQLLSERVDPQTQQDEGIELQIEVRFDEEHVYARLPEFRYEIARSYMPRANDVGEPVPRQKKTPSRWSAVKFPMARAGQDAPLTTFLAEAGRGIVNESSGNAGVLRVSSIVPPKQSERSGPEVPATSASNLIGQIAAVKPTKLKSTDYDNPRAAWKNSMISEALVKAENLKRDKLRHFAVAFDYQQEPRPLKIACVPDRWVTSGTLTEVGVSYRPLEIGATSDEKTLEVQVDDAQFQALLQYMQSGDLSSSLSLLENAEQRLYAKLENQYAAAAGGYVLVYAGLPSWSHPWGNWISNLANWFPSLPDGQILLATLLLQGPTRALRVLHDDVYRDERRRLSAAYTAVMEAVSRGIPMFRLGLQMLRTNIAILQGCAADEPNLIDVARLQEASDFVRRLNLRADKRQPFSVIDVRGAGL